MTDDHIFESIIYNKRLVDYAPFCFLNIFKQQRRELNKCIILAAAIDCQLSR